MVSGLRARSVRTVRRFALRFMPRQRLATDLRNQADAARARLRYRDAAVLYGASTRLKPAPHVSVQAGHMFKEVGDFAAAEVHYRAALAALPEDADLALQLGHFYKVSGQPDEAVRWFRRALALDPRLSDAANEAARLEAAPPAVGGVIAALLGEASATPPLNSVVIEQIGGAGPMRGVEAVRGFCLAAWPHATVELFLDGERVISERAVTVPDAQGAMRHVFNLWHDFSPVPVGAHRLEVRLTGGAGEMLYRRMQIGVAAPLGEAACPDSDGVVEVAQATDATAQIRSRASMIRPARHAYFATPPQRVLVIRADQLGDMVVSIPALTRLRALLPAAQIVGLVTPANSDLARATGLFDALEIVHWSVSPGNGGKQVSAGEQQRLGAVLSAYRFDAAIDLSLSHKSRPLLQLAGAPFTMGFDDGNSPWLSDATGGGSRDPHDGKEMAPNAARIMALIERFGTLLDSGSAVLPLAGAEARVCSLGFEPGRYVVLHDAARYGFARWPGYRLLAEALIAETDLTIVSLRDAGGEAAPTPRSRVFAGPMPFADCDALLAQAAVFVGNDSGPKHLAALRGTPVVSVHSARIDWREWAQEQTGLVISRRVPCAGCGIVDKRSCGKSFACIADIKVNEVLGAVRSLLAARAG